jgi:hypothetical protein
MWLKALSPKGWRRISSTQVENALALRVPSFLPPAAGGRGRKPLFKGVSFPFPRTPIPIFSQTFSIRFAGWAHEIGRRLIVESAAFCFLMLLEKLGGWNPTAALLPCSEVAAFFT